MSAYTRQRAHRVPAGPHPDDGADPSIADLPRADLLAQRNEAHRRGATGRIGGHPMTVSCWACTRPATCYCPTDDDGCGCPTCDLCDCECELDAWVNSYECEGDDE